MVRFRFVRLIALALAAVLWVVACSPRSTNSPSQSQSFQVGTNPWPGYGGHHVALKKGFYDQAGLKVQDTLFPSNTEEITAFLTGKLDLAWLTFGDVAQMVAKDPSLRVIFLCDYSNGSDGILGRGIKSPDQLKGKTIARENVLFENVLLRAYLEKGGLTEKDVTLQDMPAPEAATAFAAKRVDAAVTYEPFLTKSAKEGAGEVIFSSKDTNLIADVLVTRQSIIESRKTELLSYLKAADQGVKLLKSGNAEAINIVAEKLAIKPEELKEQLAGITLFDAEGNKTIGFNPTAPNNAMKSFEITTKAAYDFKVVSQPLDAKTIYDDSLVKSL